MALMVSACQQENQSKSGHTSHFAVAGCWGTIGNSLTIPGPTRFSFWLGEPYENQSPMKNPKVFFASGNFHVQIHSLLFLVLKKDGLFNMQVRFNKHFPIFHVQKKDIFLLHWATDQFSGPVMPSRGHFLAHDPWFFVCMQVCLKDRISQIIYAYRI